MTKIANDLLELKKAIRPYGFRGRIGTRAITVFRDLGGPVGKPDEDWQMWERPVPMEVILAHCKTRHAIHRLKG